MDLDGLKVDHGGLEQMAEDLSAVAAKIDDRLQALAHELEPLRTSWAGEAQAAYAVAKARWDTAIQELRELLASTARQVVSSNAAYRAADARAARAFEP